MKTMMGKATPTPVKHMVSGKEKLELLSSVNDGDRRSQFSKQLNRGCAGDQSLSLVKTSNGCKEPMDAGDPSPHEVVETAPAVEQGPPSNLEPGGNMEENDQTKTWGRREAKPSEAPVVTAVTPVTYLRSKNRKKGRKCFDKPAMTGSTVASAAGLELAGDAQMIKRRQQSPPKTPSTTSTDAAEAGHQKLEEGENGGNVVVICRNEHAAADHRPPPLLPLLTAEALLGDGGIRSISNQIKKRGNLRRNFLAIESKDGGRDVGSIGTTPRKRKGRPRRLNIGTINVLPAAGESVSESCDDQPLSMLFGLHRVSSKALDDHPTTIIVGHSSSLGDANRIDDEAGNQGTTTPTTTTTIKQVVEWNFTKRSPIWKAIETMEVFHRFPQSPHFLPLGDLMEDSREGYAVGHMVTFASAVDKAFKLLDITCSAEDINTCIDTLQDLEPHGFNVAAVQDHLKRMLSIKVVLEKLQEKKREVDDRTVELSHEESEIDGEIVELKEKMKRLQEEIASAKSKKGEKLSEIVFSKRKSASISQLIDGAAQHLEDPHEYYLKAAHFLSSFLPLS